MSRGIGMSGQRVRTREFDDAPTIAAGDPPLGARRLQTRVAFWRSLALVLLAATIVRMGLDLGRAFGWVG